MGKAEFLNPGQSVKDRAALYIIKELDEKKKNLNNKIIVEGTGGNTGIGLTLIGSAKGYKTIIVMPNDQSKEKIDLLKQLGAEVVLTEKAPFTDQKNYIQLSKKLLKKKMQIGPINLIIWQIESPHRNNLKRNMGTNARKG